MAKSKPETTEPQKPKKNWFAAQQKEAAERLAEFDPRKHPIRSLYPGINWCFGAENDFALHPNKTLLISGPPKGGKSVVVNSMIAGLHASDPEAVVIKIDPEFKKDIQDTPEILTMWGIDPNRYLVIEENSPAQVFDPFSYCADSRGKQQPGDMLKRVRDEQMPLRLLVIDGINNIMGRMRETRQTLADLTQGDWAYTIQQGLQALLKPMSDFGFATILVCHEGAERDQTELMRKHNVRAKVPDGVKHNCTFWAWAETPGGQLKTGTTYKDPTEGLEEKFFNEVGEAYAQVHNFTLQQATRGPTGRNADFVYHYRKGAYLTEREVFRAAKAFKVITTAGSNYLFKDEKFAVGVKEAVRYMADNPVFTAAVLAELHRRDHEGAFVLPAAK